MQAIESEHGVRRERRSPPKFADITQPWSVPILENAFVERGIILSLYLRQASSFTPKRWRIHRRENVELKTDTALLYPMDKGDLTDMLKASAT